MHIQSDDVLFRHAYAKGGEFSTFSRMAHDAEDAGSLAVLNGGIARIARNINFLLASPRLRATEKSMTMADYLHKQKIYVPIAQHYRTKVANGPVTRQVVEQYLRDWGFEPTKVDFEIKKYTRFFARDCYLKIKFRKK